MKIPFKLKSEGPFKMMGSSPVKQAAYGGDGRTWSQADKDSKGDLNKITNTQKAYEKEMLAKDSKWDKRSDNSWKTNQNAINKAVGSKKVYDVKASTVTNTGNVSKDAVTDLKTKGNNIKNNYNEVKVDNKTNYKNERDQNQLEQGKIQAGSLDPKTGTQLSRLLGRIKVIKNTNQLKNRNKKTENRNNPEIKINANIAKNTEELNNAAIKAGANDPKIGNMFTRLINKGKVAINKKQIKRDSKKITKLNEI
jgi:hypothetical protein